MSTDKSKEELRTHLNLIGGFLQEPDGPRLWNILTALRGPDSHVMVALDSTTSGLSYIQLEQATTCLIRGVAFPDILPEAWASLGVSAPTADTNDKVATRRECLRHGNHFLGHALLAYSTLGLTWEKINSISGDPPPYSHLDCIGQLLLSPTGPQLWDVLTALRGPDPYELEVEVQVKLATTALIRATALPLTPAQWSALGAMAALHDDRDGPQVRGHLSRSPKQGHKLFFDSARRAFRALGLKWTSAN